MVAFLVVEGEWALGHVDFSSSGSPALEHRLSICGGMGFPDGSVVKNLPANLGDTGLVPDPGRSNMPQSN